MEVRALDVKSAFLNQQLPQPIYMHPPTLVRSVDAESIWKFNKEPHGFQNAGRERYSLISKSLIKLNLKQLDCHEGVFTMTKRGGGKVFFALYVDDVVVAYEKQEDYDQLLRELSQEIDVRDLGEPKELHGIQFERTEQGSRIHQKNYIDDLLSEHGENDPSDIRDVPISEYCRDNSPKLQDADAKQYMEILGSLTWIADSSRPDLCYSANQFASFAKDATEADLEHLRGVLKYLNGSKDASFKIERSGNTKDILLTAYSSASFADEPGRESISGFMISLNEIIVSWRSERQSVVANTAYEAGIDALSVTTREVDRVETFLRELGIKLAGTPKIFDSNQQVVDRVNS